MCVDELGEIFASIPGWYIALLLIGLVGSVLMRSLILTLGMVLVSVLGISYCIGMEGVSDVVRYGMVAVLIGIAGFSAVQIVWGVKRL